MKKNPIVEWAQGLLAVFLKVSPAIVSPMKCRVRHHRVAFLSVFYLVGWVDGNASDLSMSDQLAVI